MINGHGDDLHCFPNVKINFSTNIFNGFDHSALFAHLAERLPMVRNYPEPEPLTLENEIAHTHGVEKDNVMATNGATEAIYLIAQLFRSERTSVLQPTFAEYADACRVNGIQISNITSLDAISIADADLVWVCNPNNPTGEVIDKGEILRLADTHSQSLFVVDQSYAAYTTQSVIQPQEACTMNNVMILSSMTKDFGVPGLRLGYVTAKSNVINQLRHLRMPWSVNSLAIEAGIYLLHHTNEYVINAKALCEQRQRVAMMMNDMEIETYPSDSNILLCHLPKGDAASLKEYLAMKHGILIRDASNFYGLDHSHFRIAVQTEEENNELIKAIKEWIG